MKSKILMFLFSFLIAASLLLNINLLENLVGLKITILYETKFFGVSIVTGALYYFFSHYKFKSITKLKYALSILFSIFMIIGESYATYGSYKLIFLNIGTFILSIIKVIGFTYLFSRLFSILDDIIKKTNNKDIKFKNKHLKKYLEWFNKYPFRTSFLTILIIIGVYMLAFYPIVLSPDPSFQIKMYFNEHTKYIDWVIQRDPDVYMTAHHPVLQTFMIGTCIRIGRFLINDNFGLFLYTLIQSLIYASVLAYSIKFLRDNNVKSRNSFIVLLLYLVVPMYLIYSVSAVKDTLYTAFMLLFVMKIFDIVKNYKEKSLSFKYLVIFYLIMLALSLFRHNGVYVIAVTIVFLVIYTRKNFIKLALTFMMFFASIYAFDNVLVPKLGISDGSAREMLSVPFQQTARLVKEKPDFYNGEDKEIIDYILNYDTLSERYNPNLADPVKNEFNKYTTNHDLGKYFKTWSKGLVKYPDIYVDATLNNTYGYFYPDQHNWYIYTKYDKRVTENDLVDYYYNKLGFLRVILDFYANVFPYIPIVGAISNIAINTWFVLILGVYLINSKYKKYLICLIPLVCSIGFCIIGPANTYFRYTMPYIFAIPVLTVLLLDYVRGDVREKE